MKEFEIELNDKLGGVIRHPKKWSQADIIHWTIFAMTRLALKGDSGKRRNDRIQALEQAANAALVAVQNVREIEEFQKRI